MEQIMSQAIASKAAPSAAGVPCPRCQKPLVDPQGLGWCKACGYCRSLADSEKQAPEPVQAPAKPNTLTATSSALGQTPRWFWIALFGVVVIVAGTIAGGHYLTLKPLERALLTTVQIAAGIIVMFVGQFLGLLRIAPEDSTLGFWDAVFPFRLYSLVFKRLPSTQTTFCLGVWGVAMIASAAIFVGGLEHWLNYIPKSQAQKTQSVR
jgi:hypothetical protein